MERDHQNRQPRELVSSAGFSVEYEARVFDQELRDDIVSYLGEYRFGLKKYDYDLVFSSSAEEGWRLRDKHRLEPMGIKARRSVEERRLRNESTRRELAEASGIALLEKQLEAAEEGDSIIWASPPGAEEEGYGDYGFFYVGKVRRSVEAKKEISMTAIRVENPTIGQFNRAWQRLSGEQLSFLRAEDFLRNPVVINSSLSEASVDSTLGRIFPDSVDPYQKEKFAMAIARMDSRINQVSAIIRSGAPVREKVEAIHALENYAILVKKVLEGEIESLRGYEEEEIDSFVGHLGYHPPDVKGSCPIVSSNINNKYNLLNKIIKNREFDFDEAGPCRLCGKDVPCGPCKICETCNDEIDAGSSEQFAA